MKHKIKTSFSFLFGHAICHKPSFLIVYILDMFVKAANPFINILFPKYLIAELLGNRQMERIVGYVVCIVLGNFLTNYLSAFLQEKLNKNYYDDFSKYFDALLGRRSMQIPYQSTENKEILKKAQKARDGLGVQSGGIGGIASSISQIVIHVIVMAGTLGLLISNAPLVFVIVAAGVLVTFYLNKRVNNVQIKYFEKISENNRGYEYTLYNLSDIRYGKDIRLYQAQNMMLQQANQYNQNMANIGKMQAKETIGWVEMSKCIMALREGSTFLYLGYLGLKSFIAIADFMMLVNASNAFGNSLNVVITQIQELVKKIMFAYEYVDFMQIDLEEEIGQLPVESADKHTIEFRKVSFSYPGTEKKALDEVSVVIQPGEKISIVGANGAGKTTFIKLLCRLYPVDSGEILLDGVNINTYSMKEYLKRISVVFQDFMLLGFSLKENIALEHSTDITDEEILPLLNKVGLEEKILSLPMGMHTPVFRYYDQKGFEPSGGEQQKIAIARAIYKDGAIVILDEPTAALDPISEAEIYEKFNDMVNNKTALFISHRLSSCKFCDRILVFDNGKIIEEGTHKQLLNLTNGVYANMYQTQAQYYQY